MVIQRWQSVMLLIAAIMMACFSFSDLAQLQLPLETLNFNSLGFSVEGTPDDGATGGYALYTWPLFVMSVMAIIIPVIAIFSFKRPGLQRSLCVFEMIFIVCIALLIVWFGYYVYEDATVHSWKAVICAPVIAFISTAWARRMIGKDIALIKAADRIR